MPAAVARRTRYDTPAWAERFPDTPEGLDALASHDEARRLPRHTDPDTIDDPDVRDAFVQQLRDEPVDDGEGSDQDSPAGGRGSRGARDGNGSQSPPPARLRSAFRSDAGTLGGAVDIDDAAGLLLGLLAYAVAVSAFRDPVSAPNGVKRWFAAKFLNKTSTTGNLTPTSADPQVTGLSLLTAPLTETNATPVQPVVSSLGDILRQGLPAAALTAPKPAPIPGAGG